MMRTKKQQSNLTQPSFSMGFKESIFLSAILGWASPTYILGSLLKSQKSNTDLLYILSTIAIGIFSFIFLFDISSSILKLIFCLVFTVFLVVFDCDRRKFFDNATIHFCNSIFLGLACYFVAIDLYPDIFTEPIQDLLNKINTSIPTAFTMLILCLIFQNIGYYLIWKIFSTSSGNWFLSNKNLTNLNFIRNSNHQIILFAILIGLGLVFRISSIASGRFFYASASEAGAEGVSSSIASFLAQFEPLYKVGWLYGLALLFSRSRDTTIDLKNTYKSANNLIISASFIFIILEIFYQLISGSKGRFLSFVILPIATVFFFSHKKVSNKAITIFISIIALSWLLIFPTLVIYRNVISSTVLSRDVTIINFFQKSWESLQALSWEEYQQLIFTPFNSAGNAEAVSALTSIVHFQSYLAQDASNLWQRLLFFWIPRFLWADKPEIASTNIIGRLTGRLGQDDNVTSVLTTAPGELFIYYGLMGSVLMILTGLITRWFNEATSPFKDFTAFRLAVYISYLPQVITIVSSAAFEAPTTGMILQMFTLYATLYLASFL